MSKVHSRVIRIPGMSCCSEDPMLVHTLVLGAFTDLLLLPQRAIWYIIVHASLVAGQKEEFSSNLLIVLNSLHDEVIDAQIS